MSNNKTHTDIYDVPKENWSICKLCNKTIKEIASIHGGANQYYKVAFIKHLRIDHNTEPNEYFETTCNLIRPICQCGICFQKVDFIEAGSKSRWRKYKCGRYPGQKEWSEKAKIERLGANNPMYGKKPWNKGLDRTDARIDAIGKNREGIITSDETKIKQSESAKKRTIHGHTGIKHSEESKQKMRENTLKMIKEGKFKQNKTKCYLEFAKILNELRIKFQEEVKIHYWSIDFFLIDYNTYIEVDGDYWHSNPIIYPNGPVSYSQKINWENDKRKNKYFGDNNLNLIRFWENDILNSPDNIKSCLCKLKK